MELSDYASLIEIAVTLNIAFVAVEYVRTYTRVLCNQAFKLDECINDEFSKLSLVDDVTVDNIPESTINGKSTNKVLEGVRLEKKRIAIEIASEKGKLNSKIESVCEIKNLSSVSLWMFLYGIAALSLVGLNTFPGIGSGLDLVWACLTGSTFLYALCGWLVSERRHKLHSDFSSLRHPIFWWTASLALSVFVAVVLPGALKIGDGVVSSNFKTTTVIFSVVLMFSNFIVTIIKVWVKAKRIRRDIVKTCEGIKPKCDALNGRVEALIKVKEISEELSVDMTE